MGLAETADLPLSREGENIVLWTPHVCVPPLEQSTSLFHVSIPAKREVSPLQSPPLWHFHIVSPTEITKSSLSARKSSKPFKSCPALRVLWESDRCTYRELHLDGRPGQLCW